MATPPKGTKSQNSDNDNTLQKQHPTSSWDVVMYLVQKFPTYAVLLAFLAVSYFGIQLILEQRDAAQDELNDTRQIIADLKKESDKAIAEANLKIQEAFKIEQQAEANALKEVQETMLTTAERIRSLVSGQLDSMETLEKIRKATANDMQQQLDVIRDQQAEAERKLNEAVELNKIAKFNFSIEQLKQTIDNNPNKSLDAIKLVSNAIDVEDSTGIDLIQKRILNTEDGVFKLSLQFAFHLAKNDAESRRVFIDSFKTTGRLLSAGWLRSALQCCDSIFDDQTWQDISGTIVTLIGDDRIPPENRFYMFDFFDYRPNRWSGAIFETSIGATNNDDYWKAVEFIIEVAKGEYPSIPSFQQDDALDKLIQFDPSATHVIADWIVNESTFDADRKKDAGNTIERFSKSYEGFNGPPLQKFQEFWLSSNLHNKKVIYQSLNSLKMYKRSAN